LNQPKYIKLKLHQQNKINWLDKVEIAPYGHDFRSLLQTWRTDHWSHERWTTLELILSDYKEALSGTLHSDQLLKVILPSQNRPNCPEVQQCALKTPNLHIYIL